MLAPILARGVHSIPLPPTWGGIGRGVAKAKSLGITARKALAALGTIESGDIIH